MAKQLKSGDDMVEIEIGKDQAQDFTRVIFADIHSYIPVSYTHLAFWCVVRVAFLSILTPIFRDIAVVNWVYPLTWSLSSIALMIYYLKADWLHGFEKSSRLHLHGHHFHFHGKHFHSR